MNNQCIFCNIISGRIPAAIIFHDGLLTAFQDIHPVAPVHFLVVPNKHIASLAEVGMEDATLLGMMIFQGRKIAEQQGLTQKGYRLVINTGPDAGQSVFHLHLHIIGGRSLPFRFED